MLSGEISFFLKTKNLLGRLIRTRAFVIGLAETVILELCHWLRRTFGFTMERSGVKKPNEVVRRSQSQRSEEEAFRRSQSQRSEET